MKPLCIAPLAAAFATACGGSSPTVPDKGLVAEPDCTMNAVFGIAVTTLDLSTGDTVRSRGILRLQDGAYTENAIAVPPLYYGASERPGTYTITLQMSGYRDWTATGISVTRDRCHVQTVRLTARLAR